MKTLSLIAAAMLTTSVSAHECNVDFQGGLDLKQQQLTLVTQDGNRIRIDQQQQLFVNNEAVQLTSSQQQLVNDYYQQVNTIAPTTADIALDAVDIARKGVTMAFDGLMGPNNQLSQELDETLGELQVQLNQKFYADDGSIRFNSIEMKNGDFIGDEFSKELEQKIENTVQRSIGTLMIAIGKQMLLSGGSMDEFEAKMENFGANIEREIEASASQLEERAQQLCYQVVELDNTEEQLAQSIPQLAKLNIIEVKQSESSKQM